MISIDKTKKQKIHSRRINITTYDERYSKIRFVHSRILPISLMRLSGISKLLKKDNWGSGFQPRNKMIAAESRSPKIQYVCSFQITVFFILQFVISKTLGYAFQARQIFKRNFAHPSCSR